MNVKLLNKQHLEFLSLKGGCICSSESTLVKMQHCLKSHVAAHFSFCPQMKCGLLGWNSLNAFRIANCEYPDQTASSWSALFDWAFLKGDQITIL